MGDREQTLAATGGCALIFTATTLLHVTGLAIPLTIAGEVEIRPPSEFWTSYLLTIAATTSVGVLSVYLNKQLVRFERQVSRLGALTDDMVRSLTSGLITVDTEGRVVFANAVALSYAGVDSMIGERIQDRFPSLSEALDPRHTGGVRISTQLAQAPPEPPVQLEGICCPLHDADHHLLGYVLSLEDVTELVRMRTALERSQRLAAVGSLAASVAHEVRNPLAAISGSAELLANSHDGEREKLTKLILRESSRLASTVDNLLSYTGTHAPEPRRFNLLQLLSDVGDAIRSEPSHVEMNIRVEVSGENVSTIADPAQISQIVWNLLRNAIEASQPNSEIQVRAFGDGRYAAFEVSDEGEGIDEEQIPLLFEPFFSTKPKGSGFGLAIVQRILDEH
ncbi:MAG: two-component system sensor histidine kinase NtrB, partial [Nannocystaceae bacterium]